MVITKKISKKHLAYSENFDKNFDRAQIRQINNYTVFTARVRKEKRQKFIESNHEFKNCKKKSDIIKIIKNKIQKLL